MIGFDKIQHALLGAAVAMVAIAFGASPWAAFYAAAVVGALKELRDAKGFGHVEVMDYIATTAGAVPVCLWWPMTTPLI